MTPIARAARALHDQTVYVRRIRDPENPTAEPVERVVAGRPWESLSDVERKERMADVRIVIAAIREPSEEMIAAAVLSTVGIWPEDRDDHREVKTEFHAMIDKLLAEGE